MGFESIRVLKNLKLGCKGLALLFEFAEGVFFQETDKGLTLQFESIRVLKVLKLGCKGLTLLFEFCGGGLF